MKKATLRDHYRQKRRELSDEQVKALSRAIAERFLGFLDQHREQVRTIHLFLPIEKNKEVDTWHLLNSLKGRDDIRIVISRTDFEKKRMEHFLLEQDTVIVRNEMGIPEPTDGHPIREGEIDLVVLPLLAYDEKGDRVGYGAGFYDRFLEACRKDIIKVGLSFFEPIERIEDVGEHDIVLDHCVTPERVHSFGRSAP